MESNRKLNFTLSILNITMPGAWNNGQTLDIFWPKSLSGFGWTKCPNKTTDLTLIGYVFCLNKLHKCLIKISFVQTLCPSMFFCLFQALFTVEWVNEVVSKILCTVHIYVQISRDVNFTIFWMLHTLNGSNYALYQAILYWHTA